MTQVRSEHKVLKGVLVLAAAFFIGICADHIFFSLPALIARSRVTNFVSACNSLRPELERKDVLRAIHQSVRPMGEIDAPHGLSFWYGEASCDVNLDAADHVKEIHVNSRVWSE